MSDDTVIRDMFYNGHPQREKTAIVLRLAESWFRIGSLEIHFYNKEHLLLSQLVDFIIEHHFPQIHKNTVGHSDEKYLEFYYEVVDRTAKMIASWMSVGFAHGVMNTDNFSLLGLTIDYGPFGFMENFNPYLVPNTSDDEGRYAFYKQPEIAIYNLKKLKIAMQPLFISKEKESQMETIVTQFSNLYESYFLDRMMSKLGLKNRQANDEKLLQDLFNMMTETGADFTMTFRELSEVTVEEIEKNSYSKTKFWSLTPLTQHNDWKSFLKSYLTRLELSDFPSDSDRMNFMKSVNPRYILRNWMAESATRKATAGDFSELNLLLKTLTQPFTIQEEAEKSGYASPTPNWGAQLRVSCSS